MGGVGGEIWNENIGVSLCTLTLPHSEQTMRALTFVLLLLAVAKATPANQSHVFLSRRTIDTGPLAQRDPDVVATFAERRAVPQSSIASGRRDLDSDVFVRREADVLRDCPDALSLQVNGGVRTYLFHATETGTIDQLAASIGRALTPHQTVAQLVRGYIASDTLALVMSPVAAHEVARNVARHLVDWVGILQPEDKVCDEFDSASTKTFEDAQAAFDDIASAVGVRVMLAPPYTRDRQVALSQRWHTGLNRLAPEPLLGVDVAVLGVDGADWNMVDLQFTCGDDAQPDACADAAAWVVRNIVAVQADTLWVETIPQMHTMNAWGARLVQSYTMDSGSNGWRQDPMWEHGIRGEGQYVGVADTGLDMDSLFFYDSAHSGASSSHRKVQKYYRGTGDMEDVMNGHGTHVCGSAVGDPVGGVSTQWRGVAYKAKLCFMDLQTATTSSGSVAIPSDLQEDLLEVLRGCGARVLSFSWGSSPVSRTAENRYSTFAYMVDTFMWEWRDTLVLFAAGNSGNSGPYTIGSPAFNKNGVAVGMSINEGKSGDYTFQRTRHYVQVQPTGGGAVVNYRAHISTSLGAPFVEGATYSGEVVEYTSASTTCSALPSATGKFILAYAGSATGYALCTSARRARYAAAAGAVGLLLYWSSDSGILPVPGSGDVTDLQGNAIYVAGISSADAATIVGIPGGATVTGLALGPALTGSADTNYVPSSLAYYSSLGLTADGRIKPDVVGPGEYVWSAHAASDGSHPTGEAAIRPMRGTSMATPTVAGAAALVRQYFREGWYPTGTEHSANSFTPSGALMKAVLAHGTRALTLHRYETLSGNSYSLSTSTPNSHQGWGAVQLTNVLYFSNTGGLKLFVDDTRSVSIGSSASAVYRVTTDSTSTIRATLAWTDAPVGPATNAAYNGANDLDLWIQKSTGGTKYWGNGVSGGDSKNNVEQAEKTGASAGQWFVHVDGASVSLGGSVTAGQPYSLVITTTDASASIVFLSSSSSDLLTTVGGNAAREPDLPSAASSIQEQSFVAGLLCIFVIWMCM